MIAPLRLAKRPISAVEHPLQSTNPVEHGLRGSGVKQAKALYRIIGTRRDGTWLPILSRLTWEMAVRFLEELSEGEGEFVRFAIEPETSGRDPTE